MLRELIIRLFLTFMACLVTGGIFALIASSIEDSWIIHFDKTLMAIIQSWEQPWLTAIMKTFTTIGSTPIVLLLTLISFSGLLFLAHRKAQATLVLIVIAGTGMLNTTLKLIFKRERPHFHRLIDIEGYSFPSGHTMLAFSLYGILAFLLWRTVRTRWSRIWLFCVALFMMNMIAISRIYLGVHYPSDIVGGFAASAFWLISATTVYGYVQRKKSR